MTRLGGAVEDGQLSADADLTAIADALIGTMLFRALTHPGDGDHRAGRFGRFDGLLDAILNGASSTD
jgi:hypothetical protein